jgi:hypothetical protein
MGACSVNTTKASFLPLALSFVSHFPPGETSAELEVGQLIYRRNIVHESNSVASSSTRTRLKPWGGVSACFFYQKNDADAYLFFFFYKVTLVPRLEALFMHQECLTDDARAHLWGDGTKFKASRLSNVDNASWKAFKVSCEKAYLAKQKKRGNKPKGTQSSAPAAKKAKTLHLTEALKSKKGRKGRAAKGSAGGPSSVD